MIKTKRNILLTFLSFLMIGCVLLLSTMTTSVAKADSMRSGGMFKGEEVATNSEIANRWIRVYDGGMIKFEGYGDELLILDVNGWSLSIYGEPMEIDAEFLTNSGVESDYRYMDFYLDEMVVRAFVGDWKIVYVSGTYFLEEDFVFDTTNFVIDGIVQDWSEIIEKPIRLYEYSYVEITGYNGSYLMSSFNGFSYMATEFAEPTDAPVEIYTCRGTDDRGEYVDIFFTREALDIMFGNSEELMVSVGEVYTLKEELPELPDGPIEEPTDEPSDLPTEEPSETPNDSQVVDTETAIMFGASAILLVVVVAFVVSLFKKKK